MVQYLLRQETRVDMRRRQVAQTVSHVMLDHMLSSGVMHGDSRQRGEEKVKHEVKKKDIAAVHTWYRNTIPPLRQTVLGSVSPWSGPPHRTGHRPCCDRGVNSCLMNTSNEALRLPDPCPPLLMAVEPFLLARPRLPLRYQEGVLSCEGAIRGDKEHHLHQRRCLVLWRVGEWLADAPASGLRSNCQEMASRPGCHGHLGRCRCCSLCCCCCRWLRWRWRRGAWPLQPWRAALTLPGRQLRGGPLGTCRVNCRRTTVAGVAGH